MNKLHGLFHLKSFKLEKDVGTTSEHIITTEQFVVHTKGHIIDSGVLYNDCNNLSP